MTYVTEVGRVVGEHGVCFQVAPMLSPAWLSQFEPPARRTHEFRCPCGAFDAPECDGEDCGFNEFARENDL